MELELRERILLMGPPGCGKTYQLIQCCAYILENTKSTIHFMDNEDKAYAQILTQWGVVPPRVKFYITPFEWMEMMTARETILKEAKPDDWIMVDRVDLAWPAVQRWFTKEKFQLELAEKMMNTSKKMKSSMFTPTQDQGSWQVINEQYDNYILPILFRSKCNVILTSGIKSGDDSNPIDVFGHLGVLPRGQKELPHQPHSVFLLYQKKIDSKTTHWLMTTAKDDMPKRPKFDGDQLFDFSVQYLDEIGKK